MFWNTLDILNLCCGVNGARLEPLHTELKRTAWGNCLTAVHQAALIHRTNGRLGHLRASAWPVRLSVTSVLLTSLGLESGVTYRGSPPIVRQVMLIIYAPFGSAFIIL